MQPLNIRPDPNRSALERSKLAELDDRAVQVPHRVIVQIEPHAPEPGEEIRKVQGEAGPDVVEGGGADRGAVGGAEGAAEGFVVDWAVGVVEDEEGFCLGE
jgi:hypothetical protein